MDKAARDNRANQLNPNNRAYHASRLHGPATWTSVATSVQEEDSWWIKGALIGVAVVGAAVAALAHLRSARSGGELNEEGGGSEDNGGDGGNGVRRPSAAGA